MKGVRGFLKGDPNINRGGRPAGCKPNIRNLITENLDILELIKDISSLSPEHSVKYRIELLKYIVPSLKAVDVILDATIDNKNNEFLSLLLGIEDYKFEQV